MNQLSLFARQKQCLAPGAVHVPDWLSLQEQRQLLDLCREWARPPSGIYTPRMPDCKPLSVRVMGLGWHWYPYKYSRTRDDCNRNPCKPFPTARWELAFSSLSNYFAAVPTILPRCGDC